MPCNLVSLIRILILAVFSTTAPSGFAKSTTTTDRSSAGVGERHAHLNYTEALLLGLVEGVTEYLPISSTGHLILINHLLGLDADSSDRDGRQGSFAAAEKIQGQSPRRAAINAYTIVIQAGSIAAVLLLYRRRLREMLQGLLGQSREGLLVVRNLVAAFLPAAAAGPLLGTIVAECLFHPKAVGIALVAGAFLMRCVERRQQRKEERKGAWGGERGSELHELSLKAAVGIGVLQCFALWPGTSRSMMTLVGGYLAGFRPPQAAEFSFLLGLVTLSAAAGYTIWQNGSIMIEVLPLGPAILGGFTAAVAAAVAVKGLVALLTRKGLSLFIGYRLCLGSVVLVFL